MAKRNLVLTLVLGLTSLTPAAVVYANSVRVSVTIAGVASVSRVTSETENGVTTYTATVETNSIKGYDLYVSSNGEDWSLVKSVDHYPTGEELQGTVMTTGGNIEFKAEPRN